MDNYYVYIYEDPDTEIPFYVGKGKGTRSVSHIRKAIKTNINNHFLNKIRKILKTGKLPIIYTIGKNLNEHDAYQLEIKTIKEIGRKDMGEGPLTNLTDGGGICSSSFSKETRLKLATNKGRTFSKEHKSKISRWSRNNKHIHTKNYIIALWEQKYGSKAETKYREHTKKRIKNSVTGKLKKQGPVYKYDLDFNLIKIYDNNVQAYTKEKIYRTTFKRYLDKKPYGNIIFSKEKLKKSKTSSMM
jgi:hypothetical protein